MRLIDIDSHVDEEVDVDRRVVFRDVRLARYLQHSRSSVDLLDLMHDGDRENDTRSHHPFKSTKPEPGHSLVISDEVDDSHVELLPCWISDDCATV